MTVTTICPGDLKVAHQRNPIGIDDPRPVLSWRILAPANAVQRAYQVQVASTPTHLERGHCDLWDSGRVESAATVGIVYEGTLLGSRSNAFWKVTVWDDAGGSSTSKETAFWETGLLAPEDWRGEWLAAESADEREERNLSPSWFGDVPDAAVFRYEFDTLDLTEVRLLAASDGLITRVSCDGEEDTVPLWHENAFGSPPPMHSTFSVGAGRHTLLVHAVRHPNPLMKATVALAGQLRMTPRDGAPIYRAIGTWEARKAEDGEWLTAPKVKGRPWVAPPAGPARLMRREFALGCSVRSARLYVAALGAYEVSINGRRVGEDQLQSEPTEYRDLIPYRAYEVTNLLAAGRNAIGATVADGFFASYMAPVGRYAFTPPPRRLRAMLVIETEDGSTEWIVTDDTWRSASSSITSSEIYNGERLDFRLDQPGWDRPGFDDSAWDCCWSAPEPTGRLVAPLAPPIRATEKLLPVRIDAKEGGRHVIDFGQNFAGRVRLRVRGREGQSVTVRHGEILDADGELDVRNLRAAEACDRYLLSDESEIVLEPRFTYQGFRYAEVTGVDTLEPEDVTGIVLTSGLTETGKIEIDQPIVQRLWWNTIWSQRSNFIGIPTDCPQRDERLGWTGDAQIFWDTAAYNMDVAGFTRSFCREMRSAQAADGAFPIFAPKGLFAHPVVDLPTPGWADAGVELPYIGYLHSGDRTLVDENWRAMTRYVEGVLALNPDGVWREARGADFGDHLSLDSVAFGPPTTPLDLIATTMLARDLDRMAQMAAWTGRTEDAERWAAKHKMVKSAFGAEFIDGDGVVGNGSHTGYILALRLGLIPDDIRDRSASLLGQAIRDRGTLLTTGFLGTPLALDALADIGEVELAYSLLLRTEFPSWGYMVEHGATTIWERWNGDTGDVAMNSFNHYALGAVCAFLYRRTCGIEPLAPGFSHMRVAPLPDGRVPFAAARYQSVAGPIESSWRWVGSTLESKITIPPNTSAEVALPGRLVEDRAGFTFDENRSVTLGRVGPGSYAFEIENVLGSGR